MIDKDSLKGEVVMALSKKPVTGMKDILPAEMQVRDYVIGLIQETYKSFGFSHIETPCMENIGNLSSKQGGENEKLIFKVLKRGEKLHIPEAQTEADVVDCGMRYDLTVPLSRYYANNQAQLPSPFKALQMGNVWRADRPQRGRFRQFMQCDIDILGDATCLAEIELMSATTTLLGKLGFTGFRVCFNDRRVLKAMAAYSGFQEADYDQVFIILDKMDKIGMDGVAAELLESGFDKAAADRYMGLFAEMEQAQDSLCETDLEQNDCYKYAATRMALYSKGKRVDMFVSYDPSFAMMAEWLKQLFGESEGKDGKGLFPASATFSTDLHSLGQFIQQGSNVLMETVIDIQQPKQDLFIKEEPSNFDGLNFLANQNMSVVNRKAFEGTILAHTEGGVPNIVLEVPKMDERELGYLIYFFEKACAISGYLLGVNPFDQPGVESYKRNMFALLGKPGYESEREALEAKLSGK